MKKRQIFKLGENEVLGRIRRSGGYRKFRLGPEIHLAGSAKFPASDFQKLGFNPTKIVIMISLIQDPFIIIDFILSLLQDYNKMYECMLGSLRGSATRLAPEPNFGTVEGL